MTDRSPAPAARPHRAAAGPGAGTQRRRAGTIGTLGAGPYGRPRPTGFTTPLVLTTHALLAGLRDEGMDAVAMEVSSHALDQGRVDGVHFAVAVFTNLSRDHLDYHPDMAHYGATKARLFAMPGLRAAVVNLDDPFGRGLLPALPDSLEVLGTSARGAATPRCAPPTWSSTATACPSCRTWPAAAGQWRRCWGGSTSTTCWWWPR